MLPYFTEHYGNAASTSHEFGREAKEAVEAARASIAAGIGADAREIVYTSGATESNNLAIRGVCERGRRKGNHLVCVTTEHKSVIDPLERLSRRGCDVTWITPSDKGDDARTGLIDVDELAAALRDDTLLVSVMLANNEIGTILPIGQIAAICRARGILLHCDATQALGKMPVDVRALGADLLSFSAHKLYGSKGVGALFVRRGPPFVRLECQIAGGGHEGGLRSGTLNVPGIVGFARALELCLAEMAVESARLVALRDRLYAGLCGAIEGVTLNGPPLARRELRLPHNLNVSFAGVDGEALMMNVRDLAVSSGAACTSANPEPSHVLRALGIGDDATRSSLRFGLGRFNTADEIETAIAIVGRTVRELRELAGST